MAEQKFNVETVQGLQAYQLMMSWKPRPSPQYCEPRRSAKRLRKSWQRSNAGQPSQRVSYPKAQGLSNQALTWGCTMANLRGTREASARSSWSRWGIWELALALGGKSRVLQNPSKRPKGQRI